MKVEAGQLRRWLTTGNVILVISSVPGTSNWMILEPTSGIDHFSETVLEYCSEVIDETR